MAEPTTTIDTGGDSHAAGSDADEHGHHDFHMPPNSWAPISLALGMTALFLGFITAIWLIVVGGLWMIASIASWVRSARTEYLELPD